MTSGSNDLAAALPGETTQNGDDSLFAKKPISALMEEARETGEHS
jgi:hypothetical protein